MDASNLNLRLVTEIQSEAAKANCGNGIECVECLLRFYLKGNVTEATNIACHDNDKISSHPKVKLLLFDLLPDYYKAQNSIAEAFGWGDIRTKLEKQIAELGR
jgi:hypothetical protein